LNRSRERIRRSLLRGYRAHASGRILWPSQQCPRDSPSHRHIEDGAISRQDEILTIFSNYAGYVALGETCLKYRENQMSFRVISSVFKLTMQSLV
jgi:hypothetical protein